MDLSPIKKNGSWWKFKRFFNGFLISFFVAISLKKMKKKAKEYFRKNGWGDSNVRDQTKINQKYQSKCAEAYRQTIQQEASGTASASKRFLPSSPTSPTFLPPPPPPAPPLPP